MTRRNELKPLSWTELCLFFGIPTLLNWYACSVSIPYLVKSTGLPIEASYFLSVGGLVLTPMFIGTFVHV
mgnify:CR=1 FL=1